MKAVVVSYLTAASGVTKLDRMRNEERDVKSDMAERARGVNFGVAKRVKQSTLRWCGHDYQSSVSGFLGKK